ncbi:MAG: 30S ribosomal protein S2 [Planctomycetales bacterium 4572_13]|nr:MAG: 30S ribosomal protein S2 [Planctomycetales bacterium 4572_13]
MNKELARDLIGAGVHFGHAASRWNPKMKPYIFGKRGMIHIIDVKETLKGLMIAKKLLTTVVSGGRDVVFVGTKRQAKKAVQGAAEKCGMHYISERWLGGMLTNFRTIRSRLQRLEELEAMEASGKIEAQSKKQGARLKRELNKIKTNLDGVRKMSKMPGVLIAIDAKKECIALREARKLGIPTIAVIDTDSDPDTVDVAIPANDDSIKALEIMMNQMATAIAEGKTMVKQQADVSAMADARTQKPRTRRRVLASAKEQDSQPEAVSEAPVAMPAEAPAATPEAVPDTPVAEVPAADVSDVSKTAETTAQ